MSNNKQTLELAKEVLRIEAQSILSLVDKINGNFTRAVDLIFRCKGRVIITGIGKSGLIGRKIVATLTSTGTQALFLHPVEGIHGDLGIVTISAHKKGGVDLSAFHATQGRRIVAIDIR